MPGINGKPVLILLALAWLACAQAQTALPQHGYITGIDVLVRSGPGTSNAKLSVLQMNTIVEVLQKSDSMTKVGSEEHYWYKIRKDGLNGWVYGKFISFDMTEFTEFDPYSASADIGWFYQRFGYDTHFLPGLTIEAFTVDEYRSLIAKFVSNQQSDSKVYDRVLAINALSASLFKYSRQHPDDPRYRELMAVASTQAFIEKIFRTESHYLYINYAHLPQINDKAFLLQMIELNPQAMAAASSRLQNDKEAVLSAVRKSWSMLEHASPGLRDDPEVVNTAVNIHGTALQYASEKMRADKAIVLAAINKNGEALQYVSDKLKSDREVVLAAVNKNGGALLYAPDKMKSDKEIVLAAVAKSGHAFEFASLPLRSDKQIALVAVSKYDRAFLHAPLSLKSDKDIALKAVQKNGGMLQYAINPDRSVVVAAVTQNGNALQHAPYRYTRDEEIKKIAFNTYGRRSAWDAAKPEEYTRFGEIGRVNDDNVRVRAEPAISGKYLDVMYKNTIVDVLGESKQPTTIDNEVHYWYEIRTGELRGWIYGKYLDFYVPNKNINPYINPHIQNFVDDYYTTGWFFERFGYGADFDTSKLTAESFTLDEYRDLITGAEQGHAGAMRALKASIYKHLKQLPDDPKHAFLKKKVYSTDFILKTASDGDFSHLHASALENRDIAKLLLAKDALYLEHLGALRNDRDIVKLAVNNKAESFEFAAESLRSDRVFLKELMAASSYVYRFATDSLKADRELALIAVNKDGMQLQFVPEDLKSDRALVLAAVQNQGAALAYAGSLKSDSEIVMAAIRQDGRALKHADPKFQQDRPMVLSAVQSNGSAIEFAGDDLKNDREMARAALISDAGALLLISDELKSDRDLIHIALKNVKHDNVLASLFGLVKDQPADIIAGLKALWQNERAKHLKNYGFELVGKQYWSDADFVIAVASAWKDLSDCHFYQYIDSRLKRDQQFSESLKGINAFCSL